MPPEKLPVILNKLKDMEEGVGDDDAHYLGVVVFLLTHGSDVPEEYRKHAEGIADRMLGDEEYMLQWKDPVARRNAVARELKLLHRLSRPKAAGLFKSPSSRGPW